MENVILAVHLILAVVLIGLVLMQKNEGGGLGMGGGSSGGGLGGFMSARGQANLLTRSTAIVAACFIATSLTLAILAGTHTAPRSILDAAPAGAPATGPAVPLSSPGDVTVPALPALPAMPPAAPQPTAPAEAPQTSVPMAPAVPGVPVSRP